MEVVEDEQDGLVARRATHQVSDRFEEQPPARLRIDRVGEWQRAHAGGEVRREAGDLPSVARDVLDQHRRWRRGDVLDDRVAERFVRRAHVLVARAEEHSPILSVRHSCNRRRHARLAGARLASEKHGLDCPDERAIPCRVDALGQVLPADEHGRQRDGEGPGERGWRDGRDRGHRRRGSAAVVDQLVDRLELLGAAQHLAAEEDEVGALGKSAFDERGRGARQQHLSADRERAHSRGAVDGLPVVVAPALHGLTGVDPHPHHDPGHLGPRLVAQPALCLGGRRGRR